LQFDLEVVAFTDVSGLITLLADGDRILKAAKGLFSKLQRGIRQQDVESSIGRKISHSVVSDGRTVVYALNRGVPFVVAARQARVSEDIIRIAKEVLEEEPDLAPELAVRAASKKGLFQWRAH